MKAVRIEENGGPEVLQIKEVPRPEVGPESVVVKLEAIGVNYIDTYQRSGLYPVELPFTPGMEASGVVEEVGEKVVGFRRGDPVAYTGVLGAYAEHAAVPAEKLVKLPADLDFPEGAAALLQGMTAHYLACDTYPLKKGESCLVHAAAGGVGLLLVQIAKLRGAYVYGTVSTEEKAHLAYEAGADQVILYTEKDFEKEILRLSNGRGVDVVYDSVGQATFERSLNCLRPRGTMVSFGQSSGKIDKFDVTALSAKGSLFLTRPTIFHYVADRESLLQRSGEVLDWITSGKLKLRIGKAFSLGEAADAHRSLQGRMTTGKVLLLP
jgi:NADPH2:quinone reductase